MPATTNREVRAGPERRRRMASHEAVTPAPPVRAARRTTSRYLRARGCRHRARPSTGAGRPPARALDAPGFHDPALGEPARQHPGDREGGDLPGHRCEDPREARRCSWRATNATPDTTPTIAIEAKCRRGPRRGRSSWPLRMRRGRPDGRDDRGRSHPSEHTAERGGQQRLRATTSHRTRSGPQPRIVSTPISTRRPTNEKTPPAATAASAIASPATTSTSIGPCTAALRCRTSCTTNPAFCVIVISLAPCLENHRPQQRSTSYRSPPGSRARGSGRRTPRAPMHPPGLSAAR